MILDWRLEDAETALTLEELEDLKPDIYLRSQLNVFEHENIKAATRWALQNKQLPASLMTVAGLLLLHRKMFSDVWRWAGTLRNSDKNIGRVTWSQVSGKIKQLCDDHAYWVEHSMYEPAERAIRVHHSLTDIHPFSNGNGRHARLVADLLNHFNGEEFFSWGAKSGEPIERVRSNYIAALRVADEDADFSALITFAHS